MIGSRGTSSTPLRFDAVRQDDATRSASARYWMRGVSFATLHRVICAFARSKAPVRSRDISAFVVDDLGRVSGVKASATTIYRYRSTLHRLGLMSRRGRLWRVELDDPLVHNLVEPHPGQSDALVEQAIVPFAEAVVRQSDCRELLLDLFMPDDCSTLDYHTFSSQSAPLAWRHVRKGGRSRLEVWNRHTGRSRCYDQEQAVLSVLYGIRYWMRHELGVVDEYAELGENAAIMFAVAPVSKGARLWNAQVLEAVQFVLATRTGSQWTTLEVSDLIRRFCIERRRPREVLFAALDWLCQNRSNSVVLIPTPAAVATLSASSDGREHLELSRYYHDARGRLIGDVKVHADASAP